MKIEIWSIGVWLMEGRTRVTVWYVEEYGC